MLTDTNAKYIILGKVSDARLRPIDITAINGISDQSLITHGLLKKKGGAIRGICRGRAVGLEKPDPVKQAFINDGPGLY